MTVAPTPTCCVKVLTNWSVLPTPQRVRWGLGVTQDAAHMHQMFELQEESDSVGLVASAALGVQSGGRVKADSLQALQDVGKCHTLFEC
jgi:hypothetical protein